MKVPLLTGAYTSRSVIASAQRCVNLYPEKNPEGASFPTTHYCTPGTVTRAQATGSVWRCLYTSTDNRLFGVCDRNVYHIDKDFKLNLLGQIASSIGHCYMQDNGSTILLVDGTSAGYTIGLDGLTFDVVTNDAFYGSSRIAVVDGYLLLNRPKTNQWYISLFSQIDFDSLDFASKIGAPDKIVGVMATRRNVFIFGEQTTEVWTNTGSSDFTFNRVPGAFIQFGCAAVNSLCQADGSIYWVSKSPEGECVVLRTINYDRERISTFAIENELQGYERVDDAFGYVHQMEGHYWYVLTFPTAKKTWVYDIATQQWHQRMSLDENGREDRHRVNCFAFWNGMHIGGDYENGRLYELSTDLYSDDGKAIERIRSFPHIVDDGNRVMYRIFQADMEAGNAADVEPGQYPEVRLRWSDSKGQKWSFPISSTIGFRGNYEGIARFHRLGYSRDRVFELSWSADMQMALNGAFVTLESARQ